ncbi:MAG: molybdenum cofactor biosynthesis protein MoaA [Herbaspirillum sp.]|jgi:molybdopterin molybdotransferase|nr:molybdenum cofactor biosynthesis protein MoaA [Herbaspirillum sp.]
MMDARPPLLTAAQALNLLLEAARAPTVAQTAPTLEANGRVLAADQHSQIDVPGRDNSQMDGYAVRAADCAAMGLPIRLPVSQRIQAGRPGTALAPGSAARIFTGALIPDGADAVVMQEACTVDGDHVVISEAPAPGAWIRRRGEDIRSGSVILPAGTRLRPQHLGLAASVGLAQLPVRPRLRVGVFFTGDELAMPGEALKPGAIYNSNRFLLRGLLENLGCDIVDYGIVPDNLGETRAMLRRAAAAGDLVITCGGVSVGEEDHVKPAVEAEGRLTMWQIAMKPGKPLAFGMVRRDAEGGGIGGEAFFIGLPGNPVSTFVTFLIFVRPFILRLQGVADIAPKTYGMRADFDLPKGDRRNEFLRARINAEGGLDLFPNQGSGVLTSTVWGDGLIDNPPGHAIARGDSVCFMPFSELL